MNFSEEIRNVPGGIEHVLEGGLMEVTEYLHIIVSTYPPQGYGTKVRSFKQLGDAAKVIIFRAASAD